MRTTPHPDRDGSYHLLAAFVYTAPTMRTADGRLWALKAEKLMDGRIQVSATWKSQPGRHGYHFLLRHEIDYDASLDLSAQDVVRMLREQIEYDLAEEREKWRPGEP